MVLEPGKQFVQTCSMYHARHSTVQSQQALDLISRAATLLARVSSVAWLQSRCAVTQGRAGGAGQGTGRRGRARQGRQRRVGQGGYAGQWDRGMLKKPRPKQEALEVQVKGTQWSKA